MQIRRLKRLLSSDSRTARVRVLPWLQYFIMVWTSELLVYRRYKQRRVEISTRLL